MKKNIGAFTFVELIIVLVIISILSTIGFTVYESYLGTGRDTNRVVQLKGLHQSLGTYATKSKLPFPEERIDIHASGNIFSYQGVLNDEISNLIGFKGSVYDDTFDIYPTYMLSKNRLDFQLMNFLEDQSTLQSFTPRAHAFIDYESVYPKTIGKPLGIIIEDDSSKPIHTIETYQNSGSLDITTSTGGLLIYFSEKEYLNTSNDSIYNMLPNQSCKRILDMGRSKGDGVYTLNPTGTGSLRVYCDMRTDGGGWTFSAYIDTYNTTSEIFSSEVGSYQLNRKDSDPADTDTSYSINPSLFSHNEMMMLIDTNNINTAIETNKFFIIKYDEGDSVYNGPLISCDNSNLSNVYQAKLSLNDDYFPIVAPACGSGTNNYTSIRGTTTSGSTSFVEIRSGRGIRWLAGLGGDSSRYHNAWVYFR